MCLSISGTKQFVIAPDNHAGLTILIRTADVANSRVDIPTRVNNLRDAAREKITWQTV